MIGRGKFVVLEGIDGSGKSTQIVHLALAFNSRRFLTTHEPYDEPENEVGSRIRQILLGKEENPGYTELQKMFVEARKWHLENIIKPALEGGKHVFCDRYVASTYAYHRSKGGEFDEVKEWHSECDYPADITILIQIPVEVALDRMREREGLIELFERKESLIDIYSAYEELLKRGDKYIPNFRTVDGNKNAYLINREIMSICGEIIPGLNRDGANGLR